MTRFWIIAGVLALALTIYGLVDLTVTDDRRVRRLNRILWIVVIVLVPVIGSIAWLVWGKAPIGSVRPIAPDDDPRITGPSRSTLSTEESDRRIRELEEQLKALDDEQPSAAHGGDEQPSARDEEQHGSPDDPEPRRA